MSKDLVSGGLLVEFQMLRAQREADRDRAREQIQIWRDVAMQCEGAIAALDELIGQAGNAGKPEEVDDGTRLCGSD